MAKYKIIDEDLIELLDRTQMMKNLGARPGPIIIGTPLIINGKFVRADVCSICYRVIEETWNHQDWCEHFIDEPVSAFLKEGIKHADTTKTRDRSNPSNGKED